MSFEVNAFLLAAGLGTRLKPITLTYPKPAIPFLNVPMGFYQFRYLQKLEVKKLVVNTFHLPDKVQALYENQPYFKNEIAFSHEKGEILGSAGGLKKASAHMDLSKPILMMNADEIYFTQDSDFLKKAYQQHVSNKNLATLIVTAHPDVGTKFGSIWTDNQRVKNISKQLAPDPLQNWHFIGAMFISPELLKLIPENKETNIFYDVLIKELESKSVEIYPLKCDWYETGNPADFLAATKDVLRNATPDLLSFINQYDDSALIKNSKTTSLISKSLNISEEQLAGFNVLAKSTRSKIEATANSVAFEDQILLFS